MELPTSGKSFLLRRIGYNSIRHFKGKPIAPFLIELSAFQKTDEIELDKLLGEYYSENTGGEVFNSEDYSKVILLLDGFDEIFSKDDRIKVIAKIKDYEQAFKEKYSNIILQVVLATRDSSFLERNNLLDDYEKIELLPFDVSQSFKLVQKLIPGNKIKSEKFVAAIRDSQLSNSLTRTPMALSLMAILYRDGEIDLNELPANITELYNKFTDYYLNRWDTSKGITLQYKFEESKQILGFIAKQLHLTGKMSIPLTELKHFLQNLASEYPYEDLRNIDQLLSALKERSGIIYFDESASIFYFSHQAFQEYFVSIAYDDASEEDFVNNFFNEWWSNVIVFYCGNQPKRDVFLKKVANKLIPSSVDEYFNFLNLFSRAVQASYLISNQSKKEFARKLIFYFDKFYKEIINFEEVHKLGLLFSLTTLDFILQFGEYFKRLFSSKHLNQEQLQGLFEEILFHKRNGYADITLYCLAHYLSFEKRDARFLQEFIQDDSLDARWQRIVYVDLSRLSNLKNLDEKLLRKIKKKQLKFRHYIQKQFTNSAYRYLIPAFTEKL